MKLIRTIARQTHFSPYNEPEGYLRLELYVDESLDDEIIKVLLENQEKELLNAKTYKRNHKGDYIQIEKTPEEKIKLLEDDTRFIKRLE